MIGQYEGERPHLVRFARVGRVGGEQDPAFPIAFPWFDQPRYWENLVLDLREQAAAMQEPALSLIPA